MVSEVNAEENDVIAKFLHYYGPSASFFWSHMEYDCAISIICHIAIAEPPKTMAGRTYSSLKNTPVLKSWKKFKFDAIVFEIFFIVNFVTFSIETNIINIHILCD